MNKDAVMSSEEDADTPVEPHSGRRNADEHLKPTSSFVRATRNGYAEVRANRQGRSLRNPTPDPGGAFLPGVPFQRIADSESSEGTRDNIQEAIFKANSTHQPVKDVLIARGEDPVTEIPEHFVIRKDLLERKPEIDRIWA